MDDQRYYMDYVVVKRTKDEILQDILDSMRDYLGVSPGLTKTIKGFLTDHLRDQKGKK